LRHAKHHENIDSDSNESAAFVGFVFIYFFVLSEMQKKYEISKCLLAYQLPAK